jgi:hypothetical protein
VILQGFGLTWSNDIDSHLMFKNKWVLLARCTAGEDKRSASLHMKNLGGYVVVLSTM